ncbi:SRPBCC family protein [Streptomyces sp. 1331.2]|uniref:SRPBCC family protein n=1 Tax=Streptomyces sp. 1331.2 TaxID=1938835 RepID=UPI000BD40E94|nr:SRPBCC family protein [Streptomyces sp. 1331.2]SOB79841.1 Polyketide cyclase / dehydrase and lipid transport [Streptomyces sp. 1331.2]
MRYADGPGTQCEVFVEAPLERVWELVTDIGLPARLSPELHRVAWLDGADGPAPGARFEGHNRRAGMPDWRTVSEVTELTGADDRADAAGAADAAGHRVFAWAVMDADGRYGEPVSEPAGALARWRFDLTAEDGGTRLRESVVIGPGRSGVSLAIDARPEYEEKIVDFRLGELRTGMTATLEGVKSAAEQGE